MKMSGKHHVRTTVLVTVENRGVKMSDLDGFGLGKMGNEYK